MISSVIVRLSATLSADLFTNIVESINRRSGMDVGELIDDRLLPLTIESTTNQEMEDTTRWLQSLKGVEIVDVVFVCFEQNMPGRAAV